MFFTYALLLFGSTVKKEEIRHIPSTHVYFLRHEPCTIASAENEAKALELFNYLKNGGTDRAQSLSPPITHEQHAIYGMKGFEGAQRVDSPPTPQEESQDHTKNSATLLMHYKSYDDKLPDNFLTILWGISDTNIQNHTETICQKLTRLILLFDTINPQIMKTKIAVLTSDDPLNAAITRLHPIGNIKPARSMVMSSVQGTISGSKKVWEVGKSLMSATASGTKKMFKPKGSSSGQQSPSVDPVIYSESEDDVNSQDDATDLSEHAIHIHFCPKSKHFVTGVFSSQDSSNLKATLENPHYKKISMNGSKLRMSPIIHCSLNKRLLPLESLDLTQTDIDLEYLETLFTTSDTIPQELKTIFENAHQKFTAVPVMDWGLIAQTLSLPKAHWPNEHQELFKNALKFVQEEIQKIVAQTRDNIAQTKEHICKIELIFS